MALACFCLETNGAGVGTGNTLGLMTDPEDPEDIPRLSDAFYGDGFTSWPRTELSDAVLADGLKRLEEENLERDRLKREAQRQRRAAKEIEAAWHDPHWLDEAADDGEAGLTTDE